MKISEFIYREVINISDGEKIGFVSDMDFDRDTGNIEAIFVPDKNKKFFSTKKPAFRQVFFCLFFVLFCQLIK